MDIISDGELKLLGRVRMNTVDSVNIPAIKKAINDLQHKKGGEWRLYHVLDRCIIN